MEEAIASDKGKEGVLLLGTLTITLETRFRYEFTVYSRKEIFEKETF